MPGRLPWTEGLAEKIMLASQLPTIANEAEAKALERLIAADQVVVDCIHGQTQELIILQG